MKYFGFPGWFLLALSLLAILSYLAKYRWLRTLIIALSIAYLGFIHTTFFSILHVTSLLEGKLPPFKYNPLWWEIIAIVFILSLLFGRIWCGYLCPFGGLQEFLYRITPLKVKPSRSIDKRLKFLKYIFLGVIIVLFFLTVKVNLSNYEPFTVLFTRHGSMLGWTLVIFVLGSGAVVNRFWCRYFCLAGAVLALTSRASLTGLGVAGECRSCNLCVENCSMGAFDKVEGIDRSECILCNRCRKTCQDNLVKLRIGRAKRR